MRTTLTLDDDVIARLRQTARESGQTARESGQSFKQVVNDTLRLGFQARLTAAPPPYVVKARRTGLRPGISFDSISSLLEELDGPMHS